MRHPRRDAGPGANDPRGGHRSNGDRLRRAAAGLSLAVVVALLLASPASLFGRSVVLIQSEQYLATGEGARVETAAYLRDPERLEEFPSELGVWTQSAEYDWTGVGEFFSADGVISRSYERGDWGQPVNFFIIASRAQTIFHALEASYAVQRFELETKTPTTLRSDDPGWAEHGNPSIPATRLEVIRHDPYTDAPLERRLAVHFWARQEDWRVTNQVWWVRGEIVVPTRGDYAPEEALLREFLSQAVREVFRPDGRTWEDHMAVALVEEYGALGGALMAGALLVPGGLFAWTFRKRPRGTDERVPPGGPGSPGTQKRRSAHEHERDARQPTDARRG